MTNNLKAETIIIHCVLVYLTFYLKFSFKNHSYFTLCAFKTLEVEVNHRVKQLRLCL